MNTFSKGMISGFIATVVLSLLMLAKSMMGLMPNLDVVTMLAGMAHQFMHTPATPAVGWMLHFLIGTVLWGSLFALLLPALPGSRTWVKGLSFGILAWLIMMIVVMPMAGAGLFGMRLSLMAPVATLMLHLVYGGVMGWSYDRLGETRGNVLAH